jgi:hypothetical protein
LYVEVFPGVGTRPNLVCELPNGSSTLSPITFNQKIYSVGGIMWDGQYITVTDDKYNGNPGTAIYEATPTLSGGLNLVRTTRIGYAPYCGWNAPVQQPFIVGNKNTPVNSQRGTAVVGPPGCGSGLFDHWAYPSGTYVKSLFDAPISPQGQSVSIGK